MISCRPSSPSRPSQCDPGFLVEEGKWGITGDFAGDPVITWGFTGRDSRRYEITEVFYGLSNFFDVIFDLPNGEEPIFRPTQLGNMGISSGFNQLTWDNIY